MKYLKALKSFMHYKALIFIILISKFSIAQEFIRLMSESEKLQKRKESVLKFEGFHNGKTMLRATAFFVSKNGHIISTDHMLNEYYKSDKKNEWRFEATDIKGNKYTRITVVKCRNENDWDICVLRLSDEKEMKSAWTPLSAFSEIPLGQKNENKITKYNFKVWGNPIEGDFVEADTSLVFHDPKPYGLSKDCVWSTTDHKNASLLVMNIENQEKRGGFSGAPIFDSYGDVVGMWLRLRLKTYNPQTLKCDKTIPFAVPAHQLKEFYNDVISKK